MCFLCLSDIPEDASEREQENVTELKPGAHKRNRLIVSWPDGFVVIDNSTDCDVKHIKFCWVRITIVASKTTKQMILDRNSNHPETGSDCP